MKQILKRVVGTPVVGVTSSFPQSRPWFKKIGLRVTEKLFGDRTVDIPMSSGDPLKLTNLSNNYLSFQLYWHGVQYYEPITVMVFRRLLRPGQAFYDVGANVGFFSLVAAHAFPNNKIIAFEPNQKNFGILKRNVAANNFQQILAEPIALSDKDGTALLHMHDSDMSASLEPAFQADRNSRHDCIEVPIIKLDSYVSRPGSPVPAVIKVDVEGHETAFLNGAAQTIARHKPDFIMEVLDGCSGEHTAFFKAQGYRFYPITNRGYVEAPEMKRIVPEPFHFLNYLVSAKPQAEIAAIFDSIQDHVAKLNLFETSKYVQAA